MTIFPLHQKLVSYIHRHNLIKKFEKQQRLFKENAFHPSLHTELLEPRQYRFYSFRLDRRYRAVFIYRGSDTIEILDINDHYQ